MFASSHVVVRVQLGGTWKAWREVGHVRFGCHVRGISEAAVTGDVDKADFFEMEDGGGMTLIEVLIVIDTRAFGGGV